ncbi:unnamed protein product, partial [Leptidea sinapis]
MRLADDAFVRICSAVNDLCMQVRALSCSLLGTSRAVSDRFLLQTLDKQLMSNMKKKKTAHERGAELVRSGAWASGRRWADDAPGQLLEQSTNPTFATTSLDFLVDMFNDEIEDVRLRAIDSLTKISHHIVLREDQLETILGALEDYSMDVREGLHRMLASCTVASKTCLEIKHATLVLPLTTRLLAVHPFFDMPEPDVEDPSYMCVLILVLNAAQHCTTMLPLFEEHTVKHYTLSEMEPLVSGAANFTALFCRCAVALHYALNTPRPAPSPHALQQLTAYCL